MKEKTVFVILLIAMMAVMFAAGYGQAALAKKPTVAEVEYVEGIRVVHVVLADGTPCKIFSSDLGTLSAQLDVECKL